MLKLKLPTEELISIAKGAAVAATGAALTYLLEYVSNSDFGKSTPVVVAALSVLVNYLRKVTDSAVQKL